MSDFAGQIGAILNATPSSFDPEDDLNSKNDEASGAQLSRKELVSLETGGKSD